MYVCYYISINVGCVIQSLLKLLGSKSIWEETSDVPCVNLWGNSTKTFLPFKCERCKNKLQDFTFLCKPLVAGCKKLKKGVHMTQALLASFTKNASQNFFTSGSHVQILCTWQAKIKTVWASCIWFPCYVLNSYNDKHIHVPAHKPATPNQHTLAHPKPTKNPRKDGSRADETCAQAVQQKAKRYWFDDKCQQANCSPDNTSNATQITKNRANQITGSWIPNMVFLVSSLCQASR